MIYLELEILLKSKRKELGLSFRELSELTGLSHTYIRDIEMGKYSPSFENALKLSGVLDINPKEFIIKTYKSMFKQTLIDLIDICQKYRVDLSYNEWVAAGFPIEPLSNSLGSQLHKLAGEIAEMLYQEKNENLYSIKTSFIKEIGSPVYNYVDLSETLELLHLINKSFKIQGLPNTYRVLADFKNKLNMGNEGILRGESYQEKDK